MGFSRQEYWSGLPFPSLGDLPNPGIEPGTAALQADASPSEPPGKPPRNYIVPSYFLFFRGNILLLQTTFKNFGDADIGILSFSPFREHVSNEASRRLASPFSSDPTALTSLRQGTNVRF